MRITPELNESASSLMTAVPSCTFRTFWQIQHWRLMKLDCGHDIGILETLVIRCSRLRQVAKFALHSYKRLLT